MKSINPLIQYRQGDVLLQQVTALPAGCAIVQQDSDGAVVLAYGETTGHRHAIYDHLYRESTPGAAGEIADSAIARAKSRAMLWQAPDGVRYLQVEETASLRHEEHTEHSLPPGIYKVPCQVEYTPAALQRVAD
jgi:hypothetical protein